MKLFLIVAFFTMVAASPPSLRIINGTDATLGQFPWQVSLQVSTRHKCGGSLISDIWVLTAAHCRNFSVPLQRTTVVLGIISLNAAKFTREKVVQFTLHPDYDKPNEASNDLALIRLGRAVPFSSSIQPIQLANFGETFTGIVTASGWGRTRSGNPPTNRPVKLQYGDMRLITNAVCERYYDDPIDVTMLCAIGGRRGSGACKGDSGGPGIVNRGGVSILIGAISFVDDECLTSYPTVFASVAHNRRWITRISGI